MYRNNIIVPDIKFPSVFANLKLPFISDGSATGSSYSLNSPRPSVFFFVNLFRILDAARSEAFSLLSAIF